MMCSISVLHQCFKDITPTHTYREDIADWRLDEKTEQ